MATLEGRRQKRLVYRVQHSKRYGWHLTANREVCNVNLKSRDFAIARAREYVKEERAGGRLCQIVVHRRDGKISTEWTYGQDPRRYKG